MAARGARAAGSSSDGGSGGGDGERPLGEIISEVSSRASLLVREEIQLAKAEIGDKAGKLAKGAAAGAVAAFFGLLALLYFLHALAWFFVDIFNAEGAVWIGFLIVTLLLVVVGAVAALLAKRFVTRGIPPTPELAIEEAKRTRQTIEEVRR